MSLIPMDLTHIQAMMLSDAQQMRTMCDWIADRYQTYNQNLTTEVMTAAGISSNDQSAVLALLADFARLTTFIGGTLPGVAANIRYDIAAVLGVM